MVLSIEKATAFFVRFTVVRGEKGNEETSNENRRLFYLQLEG